MATLDINALLADIFEWRYFKPDDAIEGKVAIPHIWDPGTGRTVLVLGENAGGKSFFRRIVQAATRRPEAGLFAVKEMIHLSMEGRTDTGMHMIPVARALVYGDEDHFATGEISAGIVKTAISTLRGRDHSAILYWDEPDIGMSNRTAAGAGIVIREFLDTLPTHAEGVFVTSHNPALVAQLLKAKEKPHYVYLGNENGPKTAQEWMAAQLNPEVEPRTPDEVKEIGITRFRQIRSIMNSAKAEKEAKRKAEETAKPAPPPAESWWSGKLGS